MLSFDLISCFWLIFGIYVFNVFFYPKRGNGFCQQGYFIQMHCPVRNSIRPTNPVSPSRKTEWISVATRKQKQDLQLVEITYLFIKLLKQTKIFISKITVDTIRGVNLNFTYMYFMNFGTICFYLFFVQKFEK